MTVSQLIDRLYEMSQDSDVWLDTGNQLDLCVEVNLAIGYFEAEGLPKNDIDVVLSYY